MKLQKLIITGFGPYASKQELDFEENLKDKNMFVITGNTGAGKTTIFDAINFSLYGEPSGSDRDGKSLRSDFAEDDIPTEVELFFSLRDKNYYIKRTPSYLKPKKKGEGFTESKPSAELKIIGHKTITGSKEVTREIESILGITSEQFKQLVMIPQGEFKKLLNSKSDEKEEIFRKIFGTEIFEKIQRDIKDKSIKLRKTVEQVERDRLGKIRSFICNEKNEELFDTINGDRLNIELIMKSFDMFIEKDKEDQIILENKIKNITKVIDELSKNLTIGEDTNEKFVKLDNTKKELDSLISLEKDFEAKALLLNKARKAISVKVFEDNYSQKNRDLKRIKDELLLLESNIKKYKDSNLKASEEFKIQQGKESEKEQLIKDIDEVVRLKKKVLEYNESFNNVKTFTLEVNSLKNRIEKIELTSRLNLDIINQSNKNLEKVNLSKEEKSKLEISKIEYTNKNMKLKSLITSINQWNENYKKYLTTRDIFENIESQFIKDKSQTEYLEDVLRKSQAGLLALGLEDGISCPVCGSINHPNLAILENSEITEESVKASKTSLEKIRTLKESKLRELTDINSTLKSVKDNSINLLVNELLNKTLINTTAVSNAEYENIQQIKNEILELLQNTANILLHIENKIETLNTILINEKCIIEKKENREKENELLISELKIKNEELNNKEGNLKVLVSNLDNIKKEFKGEIKSLDELEIIEKNLNISMIKLKNDYDTCEKNFNTSTALLNQELGSYKNSIDLCTVTEKEWKESIAIFKDKVLSLGFENGTDYKNSILSENEIENLNEKINDFNSKLISIKRLYEVLLKDIEGKTIVDLSIIKDTLITENHKKEQLLNESKEVFSRIRNNDLVVESCLKYNKEIEKEEKEYRTVGKLSNIINGDNTKRISFERYVLASYFEDIITASNIRFSKMTSNRFELLRKQVTGDMRKGQGLDLEVFDNYTGKSRDIKTLSGGEGFKASLSMALGLADIVQAHAGGIKLDTMFIDEGFGTLDPESLDNAIECLIDLQNDGRLVGVISHVEELKERIDARLEITSTNKGSKATFKV